MATVRPSRSPFPNGNLRGKIISSFGMDKREQALKTHRFRKRIVHQNGIANAGCLLCILAIVIVAYGAYKFGPPAVDDYQFRNAAAQIAGYAAAGVLSETRYATGRGLGEIEQVREAALLEALDLRIPLSRDNIIVEKEAGAIFITVKYMVPIRLPWGEFEWNFEYTVNH